MLFSTPLISSNILGILRGISYKVGQFTGSLSTTIQYDITSYNGNHQHRRTGKFFGGWGGGEGGSRAKIATVDININIMPL